jgi:hypothetical protein
MLTSLPGLEPVAKAPGHDINLLLRFHVPIRQRQHHTTYRADHSRFQDQRGPGYTPHHSQHLVHRCWRMWKHFMVYSTTLTVLSELLLDPPRAEVWAETDLHRLHHSLLWLLYVLTMNLPVSCMQELTGLEQLSGVPWPQAIHPCWVAVS